MTEAEASTPRPFPKEIGRFLLGTCLKSGAVSVYEATDGKLERQVVLKVIETPGSAAEEAEPLLEEARRAAAIEHPHIATVYEHGRVDGMVYVAMERLRGQTLEQRAARAPIATSRALELARGIAETLAVIHSRGFLHGDLSPSNVMITDAGPAALIDFGLGRRLEAANRPASIAGTPGFLAPEQILRRPLAPQTDVFALGALLFWMLTGREPFEGADQAAALAATVAGRARPLASLCPALPIELERLVGRALAADPADRFRSAEEMGQALAVIERSVGPGSAAPEPRADAGTPPAARPAFRGLSPFTEADRDRFFGRDRDAALLVERLGRAGPRSAGPRSAGPRSAGPRSAGPRFLVLLGESGSGKSSLLRAGVLPALREQGRLPVYRNAYGADPEAELRAELERQSLLAPAAAESTSDFLARVAGELEAEIVLVLDQFESLLIDPPEGRERFLGFLADVHARASLPLAILVSIRRDFVYRLLELEQRGWIPQPLAIDKVHLLRRLNRRQAQDVLERTCTAGGLAIEPSLPRVLARDLAEAGSVLPFELQIVGTELERRGILDRATYRQAGGKAALVDGFLDDVIVGSGDSAAAYRLLLGLVREDGARRRRSRDELAAASRLGPARVERLLERFVEARLVGVDPRSDPWRYELVHDQLALRLQRLSGQLADARDRANRLLRQYAASHRLDPATTIPLSKLWYIRRHGDPPGAEGSALIRRSLRRGLGRAALLGLGIALLTLLAAAPFSVARTWEGTVLRDGHRAAVRAAALSPDGTRLATAGEDGRLILWDLRARLPIAAVADHGGWIHDVTFSPDGGSVASIGADLRVALRDPASLEPERWLAADWGEVEGQSSYSKLDYSPAGRYLAVWVSGFGARIWQTGALEPLPPVTDDLLSGNLLFSPDERWLMSPNGTTWDIAEGRTVAARLPPELSGSFGALSPDGARLAAVSSLGVVTVWDVERFWRGGPRPLLSEVRAHRDHGRSAAVSRDGAWIATAAEDICLFDGRAEELRARMPYAAIAWDLVFDRDSERLISTHGDGAVLIWDLADRRLQARLGSHSAAVRAVAFSPEGRRLATASEDRSVLLWDLESRRIEAVLTAHETRINAVSFGAGGALYSADQNGDLIRWDLERRRPRWRARLRSSGLGLPLAIYGLTLSPDGRWAGVGVGVVDTATGALAADFRGRAPELNPSGIYGIRFLPDGEHLAVAMTYGTVHLLSVPDWRVARSGSAGAVSLIALDVSPDGRHLVTGEDEGTVRLWSVSPLEPLAVLGRHASRVKSVAFSPDGKVVASAGDDRRLMLWQVGGGAPREIATSATPVLSVAFSPDGTRLVSGGHDGSARLFERQDRLWGWRLR